MEALSLLRSHEESAPNPVLLYGQACVAGLHSTLRSRPQLPARAERRRRQIGRGGGAAFAAVIPGDSVVEQVFTTGLSSFLSLYNTAIIGRVLLTWFPQAPAAIVTPLSTLCDPYLNLFRGIIPPIGGTLDLSPVLAFVALDLFQNTAAALPCELGGKEGSPQGQGKRKVRSLGGAAAAWRDQLAARRQQRQS